MMHHTRLLCVYMEHEDKEGECVKRMKSAAAWILMGMMLLGAAGAAAQTQMQVYFAEGTLDVQQAHRLIELTQRAYPQAEWTAICEEETGESLRERILSDRAPQIAVCAPGEASAWAREGMLAPLGGRVADQAQMQPQVISACMWEGEMIMAPLAAHHRQMAVNRRMLEQERLGYMIDYKEHPVWYPSEMDQILEEFYLSGTAAMEIWPARVQDCAAIEALIQSIYGGTLLSEDGQKSRAGESAALAGLSWLRDRVQQGGIGMAQSREEALERFLAGETAIFIDWMERDSALYAERLEENGIELVLMPYPTTAGLPIRSFELAGVCVFKSGHEAEQALGIQAMEFWCEDMQAQLILGDRAVWQDDAIWLPMMNAGETGPALRSLLCSVLDPVLAGQIDPKDALLVIDTALEALRK